MKKIFALVVLIGAVVSSASAQRTYRTYPEAALSKEIHKAHFNNTLHRPATVTTSSGLVASKGIADVQARRTTMKKNKIAMGGKPAIAISKGVARQQYEARQ